MPNQQLKIEIIVDAKTGKAEITDFGRAVAQSGQQAAHGFVDFKTNLGAVESRLDSIKGRLFSMQSMFIGLAGGYGLKRLFEDALDTGSAFEQMEIKLNALTYGRGKQTLQEINAWAKDMPVNTRKAVEVFSMMQAMGLDPTIAKMQTLVDVSSVRGEDTMPRVARALGQMITLGHLSAEELNQLAEAGINARKYLSEAFGGKTVEQVQARAFPSSKSWARSGRA